MSEAESWAARTQRREEQCARAIWRLECTMKARGELAQFAGWQHCAEFILPYLERSVADIREAVAQQNADPLSKGEF